MEAGIKLKGSFEEFDPVLLLNTMRWRKSRMGDCIEADMVNTPSLLAESFYANRLTTDELADNLAMALGVSVGVKETMPGIDLMMTFTEDGFFRLSGKKGLQALAEKGLNFPGSEQYRSKEQG